MHREVRSSAAHAFEHDAADVCAILHSHELLQHGIMPVRCAAAATGPALLLLSLRFFSCCSSASYMLLAADGGACQTSHLSNAHVLDKLDFVPDATACG